LLHEGNNEILMEVYSYTPSELCLIAQIEFRDNSGNVFDRVLSDETWQTYSGTWARVNTQSALFVLNEIYDAGKEPEGLHAGEYNDAEWGKAAVVSADPAYMTLVPTKIPHFVRTRVRPKEIEFRGEVLDIFGGVNYSPGLLMAAEIPRSPETCRIENAPGILGGNNGPAVIKNRFDVDDRRSFYTYWDSHEDVPSVRSATLILDFGELVNGFIELDVEGNEGGVIDFAWGQILIDGRVPTFPWIWNSNAREGKPLLFLANRYTLRQGRQKWESYHWQQFRYLQLTFRRLKGPLKIHGLTAIHTELPLRTRGSFQCSDPFLEKLFAATDQTLRLCTYDNFMDNMIRERVIWGGDISDCVVPSCLTVFGDVPVLEQYIRLFSKLRSEEGNLATNIDGGAPGRIIAHHIRTAAFMTEYGFWCTETEDFRDEVLPSVESFLAYLENRGDGDGLIKLQERENDYIDHIKRNNIDLNVAINLLYAVLLDRASELFRVYGKPVLAEKYEKTAGRISKAIYEKFWDENEGLYIDGSYQGSWVREFSEHSNFMALYCGLGTDGRKERILESLGDPERTGKITRCGPPFMFWPPAALFSAGEGEAALNLMRDRYARCFREENQTFSELWSWYGGGVNWWYASTAQNGFGSPTWFFATEILGVKPLNPGFTEFTVEPKSCDLEWAEGVVPSPAGDIPVRWEMNDGKMQLNITVPQGTKAKVTLPGFDKTKTLGPGKHSLKGK
jgi:hypothetical protein